MSSGGATDACSTRSPGSDPAVRHAATASAKAARVTQCTAMVRSAPWATRMPSTTSSRPGRASSPMTIFTGPRSIPAGKAAAASGGPPVATTRRVGRACSRSDTAESEVEGVASVTPVMPYDASLRATAATSGGPSVSAASMRSRSHSSIRNRRPSWAASGGGAMASRAALLSTHMAPDRCCTRTLRPGARASSRYRSSGPSRTSS